MRHEDSSIVRTRQQSCSFEGKTIMEKQRWSHLLFLQRGLQYPLSPAVPVKDRPSLNISLHSQSAPLFPLTCAPAGGDLHCAEVVRGFISGGADEVEREAVVGQLQGVRQEPVLQQKRDLKITNHSITAAKGKSSKQRHHT